MHISKEKQDRIKEAILSFLFHNSPKAFFTADIAREIVRDEEFTKKLLLDLQKKGFVVKVKKNPKGIEYSRRERWRLSSKLYSIYKKLAEKGIEVY